MSMESAAGDTVIRIDAETTYQVIRGFGVSGAWWTIETEDWPEENKQYLARLFFDRESGIGLSMYRYNFGAGGTNPDALGVGTDSGNTANDPWRTPVGLEIAPGIFNPARDKGGLWFLKAAQDAGVREIIGFVNSPPARFTRNRGVTGSTDGLSNIDPAMHHDFARYLVDLVRFMWENGYRINWLSPFNEPDIEWNPAKGQEGCSYSAQEAAMLLATVRKEIVAADLPVELTPFELCGWDRAQEYLKAINAFPEITDSLSVFSIHRYESGPSQRERVLPLFRKDFPKTELWMSEWTQLEQGRDAGMDSGLVLANMIHDDLASMNASSWQYWIAMSKYDYHDGLVYITPGTTDLVLTKRFWVMGNFSRFIRPGFSRIHAESGNELLRVSAYMSGSRVIVVCINNSSEFLGTRLDLDGFQTVTVSALYRTTESLELASTGRPLSVRTIILHPRSVTTLILECE